MEKVSLENVKLTPQLHTTNPFIVFYLSAYSADQEGLNICRVKKIKPGEVDIPG